jgi:hypothetical protein
VLFRVELKREVGGKSFAITRYLLVEPLHGHAIEFCEVHVEYHSLMAKNQNARFDGERGRARAVRHFEQSCNFRFFHFVVAICDLKIIDPKIPNTLIDAKEIFRRFPILV